MKHLTESQLRQLAQRFDQGLTTVAEEHALMRALADTSRPLPADLEPLRAEAQWYTSLHTATKAAPRVRPWRRMAMWATTAAAVVAMAVVSVNFVQQRLSINREYDLYAGSYVIRNGVKYTNIAEILPELKHAEKVVEQSHEIAQREMERATAVSPIDHDIIDMTDPAVQEIVNRIMQ